MPTTRGEKHEVIKILPFELEGQDMLDIRFWKKTKSGPRPTKRGIAINQKMIIHMIRGLQQVFSQISSEAAREESEIY